MSFTATYPGLCVCCDEWFGKDTVIEGNDGDYRHFPICPGAKEEKRPGYLAPKTSTEDMGY